MTAFNAMHQNALRYLHTRLSKMSSDEEGGGGHIPTPEELLEYDFSVLDFGEEIYAYGVLIDFTNGKSSPDLTRIGNLELHKSLPVQSQYKGCIWDYVNKKILYYLNPDDWTQNSATKSATEVLADMENPAYGIRVETPKFYACSKVLATDGMGNTTMAKVMFSTIKVNAHYIEIPRQVTDFRHARTSLNFFSGGGALVCNLSTDTDVYGGYLSTKNDITTGVSTLLHPVTNLDRSTAREWAHESNTHLQCYEYYKWLFYWAFAIEYATLWSAKPMNRDLDENGFHQGGLGPGMTSIEAYGSYYEDDTPVYNPNYKIDQSIFDSPNDYFKSDDSDQYPLRDIGVTNTLGNHTGEITHELSLNNGTGLIHQNRYRGFEFPFGDIYTILDGFVGATLMDDNDEAWAEAYFVTDNPEGFKDEIPSSYGPSDVTEGGWRIGYFTDKLDSGFSREGYDEGAMMFANIGNNADLFPQKWYVDGDNYYKKYFCNYFYPINGTEVSVLRVGCGASDHGAPDVGLGDFHADAGVSSAYYGFGFRCFNIIKDDGTVI